MTYVTDPALLAQLNGTGNSGPAVTGQDYMKKVARVESNNNPNARAAGSSATGLFQMTRGTFNDLQKNDPILSSIGWDQHKSDPVAQEMFANALAEKNEKLLRSRGHEANDLNRYLYHFAGAGGANKLISAPNEARAADVLGPQFAQANPSLANMNVGQMKNFFNKRLGQPSHFDEGGYVNDPALLAQLNGGAGPVDNPVDKSAAPIKKPEVGHLEGLARSGLQGATFGFGDELIAKARASEPVAWLREKIHGKPQSRDYNQQLRNERARLQAYQEDSPVLSTGAEIVGGLAPTAAAYLSGAGAPVGAANTARMVTQGGNLVSRLIANPAARAGAAVIGGGALSGAGTADTDTSKDALEGSNIDKRISGAGEGAALSALFAPVIAVGGSAAVKGIQKVKNVLSKAPEAAKAETKVLESLLRDEVDPSSISRAARENLVTGTDARVLDAGGKNTKDLTQTMISKASAGGKELAQTMENRIEGAKESVAQRLNNTLSSGKDYFATKEALEETRKTAAKPLYEKAYSGPAVQNEALDSIITENPNYKTFYDRAVSLAQQDASSIQAKYAEKIADAGSQAEKDLITQARDAELRDSYIPTLDEIKSGAGIPVKALDYIKRGMDNVISAAYSPSATSVEKLAAPTQKELRTQFLRIVDKASPDYAKARAVSKGAIQSDEAAQAGRDTFMKTKSGAELKQEFSKLDDHDKDYFRIGAKEALLNSILNNSQDINAAKKIIHNPVTKEKISVLFDNPKAFARFEKGMEQEMEQMITAQRSVRGSPTQPRLASEANWDKAQGIGDLAGHAANVAFNPTSPGSWLGFAKQGVSKLRPSVSEEEASSAARMLNIPLTVENGGRKIINPEVADFIRKLQNRKATLEGQQNLLAEPWRLRTIAPTAALGVTEKNQPTGYLQQEPAHEAAGGYIGGPLASFNKGPLSLLHS